MHNNNPLYESLLLRAQVSRSNVRFKVLTLVFFGAICLLSVQFLATSPAAYAATSVYVYKDWALAYNYGTGCTVPSQDCPVRDAVGKGTYQAICQTTGYTYTDLGYTNNWWSLLEIPNNGKKWVSNVRIRGGEQIAGVPICTTETTGSGTTTLSVSVYASQAPLRAYNEGCLMPRASCAVTGSVTKGAYHAMCQRDGGAAGSYTDLGYTNTWWSLIKTTNGSWGWVSNVYLRGGKTIAGIPVCNLPTAPQNNGSMKAV